MTTTRELISKVCAELSAETKPVTERLMSAINSNHSPEWKRAEVERLAFEGCDFAWLEKVLLEKNKAYGDSALEPVRIFSTAGRDEQIKVRLDDKLSRIARGSAAGEDVLTDLRGYLVLLKIAETKPRLTASDVSPGDRVRVTCEMYPSYTGTIGTVYSKFSKDSVNVQRDGDGSRLEFGDFNKSTFEVLERAAVRS